MPKHKYYSRKIIASKEVYHLARFEFLHIDKRTMVGQIVNHFSGKKLKVLQFGKYTEDLIFTKKEILTQF